MADTKLLCPKCGSDQLTANKKGFSGKKAVAGELLVGPMGLLAGTIGSNKIKITCLSCGNVFKPGQGASSQQQVEENKKNDKAATKWALIILAGLILFYGVSKLFGGNDKTDNSNEKKEETITGSYNDLKNPAQTQFITSIMTYAIDKQNMIPAEISSNVDKIIDAYFKQSNKIISDWQATVLYTRPDETKQHIIMYLEAGQLKSEILECLVLVDQVEDPKDKNNLLKKGTQIFNKASSITTDQNIKFSADVILYEPTKVEKSGDKIFITTRIKVKLTQID